jgi:hypothetical protein
MGMSRLVCLALGVLVLTQTTGCVSYFKRKDCESKNWYEYGQKVALSGKRLSGDGFLTECRKVEAAINEGELDRGFKQGMAEYCQPTQVFALGKSGEFFSADMCDGSNVRVLTERHKAGVTEYCQKNNGYTAGATGKVYNSICPKELEPAFLPEFKRGRKRYLSTMVIENEKKINDLEREAMNLERERNMKVLEAQRLQIPTGIAMERRYDAATGTVREQVVQQMSDDQKRAAEDMRWRIQNLDNQINSKRTEQSRVREKNRELQLEIIALDERSTHR